MDDVKHMQGIWLISEIFVKDKTTGAYQQDNVHAYVYEQKRTVQHFYRNQWKF